MPLHDRVFLEIEAFDRTGVFELYGELEEEEEISRQLLVGERGQYIKQAFDIVADAADFDFEIGDPGTGGRRMGYDLDGGAGSINRSISWESSFDEDHRWGDGSSDPTDRDDYTRYDAQGCHPVVKRDVLSYWLSQARTDSTGRARLYAGEWTDGTYADTAGEFDAPMPVVVVEARMSREPDDSTVFTGTLELRRTATLPEDDIDSIVDAIGDALPDWG